MPLWTFRDYITERGRNLIQEWYNAHPPEVQAAFNAALAYLRATSDWRDKRSQPYFKELQDEHVGLAEIRFSSEEMRPRRGTAPRRRFRPVGLWREGEGDFVFLVGAEEKGKSYIPPNAFDTALKYKRQFHQNRGTTSERK